MAQEKRHFKQLPSTDTKKKIKRKLCVIKHNQQVYINLSSRYLPAQPGSSRHGNKQSTNGSKPEVIVLQLPFKPIKTDTQCCSEFHRWLMLHCGSATPCVTMQELKLPGNIKVLTIQPLISDFLFHTIGFNTKWAWSASWLANPGWVALQVCCWQPLTQFTSNARKMRYGTGM